mmetsp:Transcript_70888/g.148293  ORF Transcript_70888/g.148293 Transcript_70888/m.148293 type:complete len:465 (+) Transcript_70888:266-1660(+)
MCRTHRSVLDVAEGDGDSSMLLSVLEHVLVSAVLERARATADAELSGVAGVLRVEGFLAVQPQHAAEAVVPDGHGQDHSPLQCLPHSLQLASVGEACAFLVEGLSLIHAHLIGDGVNWRLTGVVAEDASDGVVDHPSVLHVVAANLHQVTIICSVRSDELGHNGHGLKGVHSVAVTGAPELLVSHTERGKAATVLVTVACRSVAPVAALLFAFTYGWARNCAGMHSVDTGLSVGLQDVHLVTAISEPSAVAPALGLPIGIHRTAIDVPIQQVCIALDVPHAWALGVTIAGAMAGADAVGIAVLVAILVHLDEIEGCIHAARQRRQVDVEGELLVQEFEHLIVVRILQHVDARSIGKFQLQAVVPNRNRLVVFAVGLLGNSLSHAILSASVGVWAELLVPELTRQAIVVPILIADPSPLHVHDDFTMLAPAVVWVGALLNGHVDMLFRRDSANQLGVSHRGHTHS